MESEIATHIDLLGSSKAKDRAQSIAWLIRTIQQDTALAQVRGTLAERLVTNVLLWQRQELASARRKLQSYSLEPTDETEQTNAFLFLYDPRDILPATLTRCQNHIQQLAANFHALLSRLSRVLDYTTAKPLIQHLICILQACRQMPPVLVDSTISSSSRETRRPKKRHLLVEKKQNRATNLLQPIELSTLRTLLTLLTTPAVVSQLSARVWSQLLELTLAVLGNLSPAPTDQTTPNVSGLESTEYAHILFLLVQSHPDVAEKHYSTLVSFFIAYFSHYGQEGSCHIYIVLTLTHLLLCANVAFNHVHLTQTLVSKVCPPIAHLWTLARPPDLKLALLQCLYVFLTIATSSDLQVVHGQLRCFQPVCRSAVPESDIQVTLPAVQSGLVASLPRVLAQLYVAVKSEWTNRQGIEPLETSALDWSMIFRTLTSADVHPNRQYSHSSAGVRQQGLFQLDHRHTDLETYSAWLFAEFSAQVCYTCMALRSHILETDTFDGDSAELIKVDDRDHPNTKASEGVGQLKRTFVEPQGSTFANVNSDPPFRAKKTPGQASNAQFSSATLLSVVDPLGALLEGMLRPKLVTPSLQRKQLWCTITATWLLARYRVNHLVFSMATLIGQPTMFHKPVGQSTTHWACLGLMSFFLTTSNALTTLRWSVMDETPYFHPDQPLVWTPVWANLVTRVSESYHDPLAQKLYTCTLLAWLGSSWYYEVNRGLLWDTLHRPLPNPVFLPSGNIGIGEKFSDANPAGSSPDDELEDDTDSLLPWWAHRPWTCLLWGLCAQRWRTKEYTLTTLISKAVANFSVVRLAIRHLLGDLTDLISHNSSRTHNPYSGTYFVVVSQCLLFLGLPVPNMMAFHYSIYPFASDSALHCFSDALLHLQTSWCHICTLSTVGPNCSSDRSNPHTVEVNRQMVPVIHALFRQLLLPLLNDWKGQCGLDNAKETQEPSSDITHKRILLVTLAVTLQLYNYFHRSNKEFDKDGDIQAELVNMVQLVLEHAMAPTTKWCHSPEIRKLLYGLISDLYPTPNACDSDNETHHLLSRPPSQAPPLSIKLTPPVLTFLEHLARPVIETPRSSSSMTDDPVEALEISEINDITPATPWGIWLSQPAGIVSATQEHPVPTLFQTMHTNSSIGLTMLGSESVSRTYSYCSEFNDQDSGQHRIGPPSSDFDFSFPVPLASTSEYGGLSTPAIPDSVTTAESRVMEAFPLLCSVLCFNVPSRDNGVALLLKVLGTVSKRQFLSLLPCFTQWATVTDILRGSACILTDGQPGTRTTTANWYTLFEKIGPLLAIPILGRNPWFLTALLSLVRISIAHVAQEMSDFDGLCAPQGTLSASLHDLLDNLGYILAWATQRWRKEPIGSAPFFPVICNLIVDLHCIVSANSAGQSPQNAELVTLLNNTFENIVKHSPVDLFRGFLSGIDMNQRLFACSALSRWLSALNPTDVISCVQALWTIISVPCVQGRMSDLQRKAMRQGLSPPLGLEHTKDLQWVELEEGSEEHTWEQWVSIIVTQSTLTAHLPSLVPTLVVDQVRHGEWFVTFLPCIVGANQHMVTFAVDDLVSRHFYFYRTQLLASVTRASDCSNPTLADMTTITSLVAENTLDLILPLFETSVSTDAPKSRYLLWLPYRGLGCLDTVEALGFLNRLKPYLITQALLTTDLTVATKILQSLDYTCAFVKTGSQHTLTPDVSKPNSLASPDLFSAVMALSYALTGSSKITDWLGLSLKVDKATDLPKLGAAVYQDFLASSCSETEILDLMNRHQVSVFVHLLQNAYDPMLGKPEQWLPLLCRDLRLTITPTASHTQSKEYPALFLSLIKTSKYSVHSNFSQPWVPDLFDILAHGDRPGPVTPAVSTTLHCALRGLRAFVKHHGFPNVQAFLTIRTLVRILRELHQQITLHGKSNLAEATRLVALFTMVMAMSPANQLIHPFILRSILDILRQWVPVHPSVGLAAFVLTTQLLDMYQSQHSEETVLFWRLLQKVVPVYELWLRAPHPGSNQTIWQYLVAQDIHAKQLLCTTWNRIHDWVATVTDSSAWFTMFAMPAPWDVAAQSSDTENKFSWLDQEEGDTQVMNTCKMWQHAMDCCRESWLRLLLVERICHTFLQQPSVVDMHTLTTQYPELASQLWRLIHHILSPEGASQSGELMSGSRHNPPQLDEFLYGVVFVNVTNVEPFANQYGIYFLALNFSVDTLYQNLNKNLQRSLRQYPKLAPNDVLDKLVVDALEPFLFSTNPAIAEGAFSYVLDTAAHYQTLHSSAVGTDDGQTTSSFIETLTGLSDGSDLVLPEKISETTSRASLRTVLFTPTNFDDTLAQLVRTMANLSQRPTLSSLIRYPVLLDPRQSGLFRILFPLVVHATMQEEYRENRTSAEEDTWQALLLYHAQSCLSRAEIFTSDQLGVWLETYSFLCQFPHPNTPKVPYSSAWLPIDHTLLAQVALGQSRLAFALLHAELAVTEPGATGSEVYPRDTLTPEGQNTLPAKVQHLLTEVYTRMEDPDAFYTIPCPRFSHRYLLNRLQHEHKWPIMLGVLEGVGPCEQAEKNPCGGNFSIRQTLARIGYHQTLSINHPSVTASSDTPLEQWETYITQAWQLQHWDWDLPDACNATLSRIANGDSTNFLPEADTEPLHQAIIYRCLRYLFRPEDGGTPKELLAHWKSITWSHPTDLNLGDDGLAAIPSNTPSTLVEGRKPQNWSKRQLLRCSVLTDVEQIMTLFGGSTASQQGQSSHISTLVERWESQRTMLEDNLTFEELHSILLLRHHLLEAVLEHSPYSAKSNHSSSGTPLTQESVNSAEVQRWSRMRNGMILTHLQVARGTGHAQTAYNLVMANQERTTSTPVTIEDMFFTVQLRLVEAKLYYQWQEPDVAIQCLQDTLRRVGALGDNIEKLTSFRYESQEDSITLRINAQELTMSSTQVLAFLRAQLLTRLGKWQAALRAKRPEVVLKDYFQVATEAMVAEGFLSHTLPIREQLGQDPLVSRRFASPFYTLATYAQQQYENNLRSESVQALVKMVDSKTKELETCTGLLGTSTGRGGLRSQSRGISDPRQREIQEKQQRRLRLQLDQDRRELERVQQHRTEFLLESLRNFARCLELTTYYDQSVYNLCALWLSHYRDGRINDLMANLLPKLASHKFVGLIYQVSSRLGTDATPFQKVLRALVERMATEHPYHCIYQLFALRNNAFMDNTQGQRRGSKSTGASKMDKEGLVAQRSAVATKIIQKLFGNPALAKIIRETEQLSLAYIELAYTKVPKGTGSGGSTPTVFAMSSRQRLSALPAMDHIPVATLQLPVNPQGRYTKGSFPTIQKFDKQYRTAGGINLPKIIKCYGSDGCTYRQLVKGQDDLRQDAVLQQLFELVNTLLIRHRTTRQRQLQVRTYKVIPLTPRSGVLQWVTNTLPLGNWLGEAHPRYYPKDLTPHDCRKLMVEEHRRAHSTPESRREVYQRITQQFHPVFRYFFLESFATDPQVWYQRRCQYVRSVAAASMVGYTLSIGDRHAQNILVDLSTAETVHIDLGIALDQGKLLPTPELVPFRLTRDMVDGLGVQGTQGLFQKCSEATLGVLRDQVERIVTVLDVLKFDPLYLWTLSPAVVQKIQRKHRELAGADDVELGVGGDNPEVAGVKLETEEHQGNPEAERAILNVKRRLVKDLSVECQVNELVQTATDPQYLARMFPGWQPWM
ncbi:Serine/threonine-protein kinase tel1 [Dispira parvispora]|uniref:Serine/threonine-protein kinase ATM n=1 Tax=Dispira parvispora TaxID=1520584 RepID=A0A9W8E9B1_9FUNG|nr:Serine/threonine-protein kinase tel1 [Dispira parvispora]